MVGEGRKARGEGRRAKGEGRRRKANGGKATYVVRPRLSPLDSGPSPLAPRFYIAALASVCIACTIDIRPIPLPIEMF
jgi:hypothetical protein